MTAMIHVVEDDADHCAALCDLIEASGYEAQGFLSGEAALAVERVPDLVVTDLATGQPVPLPAVAPGRPMVLNLWATWCPPCRREMPALARAQAAFPGVHFVFANQGESLAEVQPYLTQAGLPLKNVLLDGGSQLSAALTARALPTTAFYDAQGRLVEVHMGELTSAAIARQLQAMGVDLDKGVLRLSSVHYTSHDDVARLIKALDRHL